MTFKTALIGAAAAVALMGCEGALEKYSDCKRCDSDKDAASASTAAAGNTQAADNRAATDLEMEQTRDLSAIMAAQSDAHKARYDARNPQQTLNFFGIEPGMTVVEALPGGGWYSKLLIPYLGDNGHLIGVDYAIDMWPNFGGFATPEFIENKKTWPAQWVKNAAEWRDGSTGKISAFAFGDRDTSMDGTVDAVLFIRAMHNLSRFEDEGAFLTEALADTHALLKPGGVVGVVQHQAPEGNSDVWAKGSNGYLKKSTLIAQMDAAGFSLIKQSDINANPNDNPSETDVVWRLPPSLRGSKDNPELKAQMQAIGESNRMTLLFQKR